MRIFFEKNYNDKIRPPLVIFSVFLKRNTTTKSSANIPSVEPNDKIRPPLVIFSVFLKRNTTTKSSANIPGVEPNGHLFGVNS